MAARYVLDTNVLVYALDRREPEKRDRAREVLRRLGASGAILPAQVLSEFANVCLRKLEPLLLAFPVLPLTGPVVLEAVGGVREHLLSYYDAQIWAVARLGQVGVVLSEDFNPGAVLDGVSFANSLDSRSTSPNWGRPDRRYSHRPQRILASLKLEIPGEA